jgi:hypothetical protein
MSLFFFFSHLCLCFSFSFPVPMFFFFFFFLRHSRTMGRRLLVSRLLHSASFRFWSSTPFLPCSVVDGPTLSQRKELSLSLSSNPNFKSFLHFALHSDEEIRQSKITCNRYKKSPPFLPSFLPFPASRLVLSGDKVGSGLSRWLWRSEPRPRQS